MQDKINAAVNERNCTIGNNFAIIEAIHGSQPPAMVKVSFLILLA